MTPSFFSGTVSLTPSTALWASMRWNIPGSCSTSPMNCTP